MGADPYLLLMGWNGQPCDPRSPMGGGGPGTFRWAGATADPFEALEDALHPLSPMCRPNPCILGAGPSPAHSTVVTWAETAADFARWEGRVPHMYLDTRGLVTVGIGQRVFSLKQAQGMPFERRSDKAKASADEIKADHEAVLKQPAGKRWPYYTPYTKLDLPEEEIDRLLREKVDGFEADLRASFAGYDNYPAPAKRALMDMIYNLGKTGLLKFTTLKKAAEAGEWKKAAERCRRIGPSDERNDWTRDLFLEAAR